jgi:hypothetical protein
MLHFIYFLTNISTEYFKRAAHSPFFSSKCRLFHNATFFGSCIFTFYIQGVLKFKCKTPVPKGLFLLAHWTGIEEEASEVLRLEHSFIWC